MQVYTYSEARQKLAIVLEQAEDTGKVLIRRKDGRTFALVPEKIASSPLDVPSIKARITTQELVDIVREGRERQNRVAGGFSPPLPTVGPTGIFTLAQRAGGEMPRHDCLGKDLWGDLLSKRKGGFDNWRRFSLDLECPKFYNCTV